MESIEERLDRIERMLALVLERLSALESLVGAREARVAMELVAAFSVPAQRAIEATRLFLRAYSRLGGGDEIQRAILEALAVEGPMSLRQLEKAVRRLRGSASRRVIRRKVEELEGLGLVRVERRGSRMVISIVDEG